MPLHRLASLCLIVTASAQELSGPGALEAERSSAVPSASLTPQCHDKTNQ